MRAEARLAVWLEKAVTLGHIGGRVLRRHRPSWTESN